MRTYRRLLVVGSIALVAGLVILFPARVAYQWFAPDNVRFTGIDGSVWNGSAAEGILSGVYIRDLDWRLRPLALFTGTLSVSTAFELAGGQVESDLGISPTGNVSVRDLDASLPLAGLERILLLNGVSGNVALQVSRADIRDGWPQRLDGTVTVANLLINNLSRSALGSFRAEFQTADDAIVGSVEDTDGVLDLAGTIRLSPDRNYSFTGQVGATAGAPATVTDQLRYLGSPNDRGLREFRFEGSL